MILKVNRRIIQRHEIYSPVIQVKMQSTDYMLNLQECSHSSAKTMKSRRKEPLSLSNVFKTRVLHLLNKIMHNAFKPTLPECHFI